MSAVTALEAPDSVIPRLSEVSIGERQSLQVGNLKIEISWPGGNDSSAVDLSLTCLDSHFRNLGEISVLRVRDLVLADAIGRLTDTANNGRQVVSSENLNGFLSEIADSNEISSTLGSTIEEVVSTYSSELAQRRNPYLKDPPGKPQVRYYDLKCQTDDQQRHRLVYVKDPSKTLLYQIAKTTGVSDGTIELCLRGNQPPLYFRSKESCFFVLDELKLENGSFRVESDDLFVIINANHTVVISPTDSPAITQILKEIHEHKLMETEIAHPNHLLARIFGCTLHRNNDVIEKFFTKVEQLKDSEASRLPNSRTRSLLDGVEDGIRVMRSALGPSKQPLMAMLETDALFGAKPRDSIARYLALLSGLEEKVKAAMGSTEQIRNNWHLNQEAQSNSNQQRLNVAVGLLAPPGLGAGIIEALGADWSTPTRWIVFASSFVVSAALLIGMRFKDERLAHGIRSFAQKLKP